MKRVFHYLLRFKNSRAHRRGVKFVAPNREAYAKAVRQVVEQNKAALEALRDR